VRGFASNREVGRTDRRGNLLVTDLLPYYANVLSIADTDVPLNYKVGEVQMNLAPPYRGGAVARFPVQRVQRTIGRMLIVTAAGERAPAYGELAVTAGKTESISPVGADGQFYFDSLPAGSHPAAVTFAGQVCRFTLTVPEADTDLVELGTTKCVLNDSAR
jgi:outer membrane usher protein